MIIVFFIITFTFLVAIVVAAVVVIAVVVEKLDVSLSPSCVVVGWDCGVYASLRRHER